MLKKTLFVLFSGAVLLLGAACQTAEKTNVNTAAIVAPTAAAANANIAPANVPPEFSGKEIPAADITPPVMNNLPNGATPAPGIPDPATVGKTAQPKNTPKIPGIPSQEELRKQMNAPVGNSKITERKPPVTESNSNANPNDGRPRAVRTP